MSAVSTPRARGGLCLAAGICPGWVETAWWQWDQRARAGLPGSAAGLDLLYGGPVRECYAAPLFVVMLPPLLRGLMVRYDGC